MKKRLEKAFTLVAALSLLCAPIVLMMIGIWMIYNIGLWIGLAFSIAGACATVLEYELMWMDLESKKKEN